MIDHDALDKLKTAHRLWRMHYPDLSKIYVSGEGDAPIALLFGEAPGGQEEIRRRPFVGTAGIVMRDLMALAGLYSEAWKTGTVGPKYEAPTVDPIGGYAPNCWLTNVVKFRPPRNRTPIPREIMSVRQLLRDEWFAVGRPRIIIPVGGVALHALSGRKHSILAMAGKMYRQKSVTRPRIDLYIWPMVHPSFGVRSGNAQIQELLERDWLKLGAWLNERY